MSTPLPVQPQPAGPEYFQRGPSVQTSSNRPPMMTEDEERRLVKFAVDSMQYLRGQMLPIHTRWVDNWGLYYAKRPDPRDPQTEKWRAHVVVPQAFFNTEAKVAQLIEILMSADPPVQPDPVFESAEQNEKSISNLINYTLRRNMFRRFLARTLRGVSVQGLEFVKTTWAERYVTVPARPNGDLAMEQWEKAMNEARMQQMVLPTTPMPWQDLKGYEEWRANVNAARRLNQEVPPYPLAGPTRVQQFRGPKFDRVPGWGVFMDPQIEEVENQPVVVHEMFKPRSWLMNRTGPDSQQPYDPARVEFAMRGWSAEKLSAKAIEVAQKLGIPANVQANPQLEVPVQIWEVYRPNSTFPFTVILNEAAVINKNPRMMPFEDGMVPITPIRNIWVPNFLQGPGDYDAAFPLFAEQDALRSLRLDAVTLHTLPVLKGNTNVGLPDLQRRLRPGGYVQYNGTLEPLIGGDVNPAAYQEVPAIGADIDRTMGIGEGVRGGTATVGRVPATTETQRLNSALTRIKLHGIVLEDDLSLVVQQSLSRWAQFGFDIEKPLHGPNPLKALTRENLLEALASDYQFRGATQAINRELQAQQLIMFLDKFQGSMTPSEIRALMKQVATAMGLRGISKIISEEGTQMLTQQFQQQMAAQTQQAQAQQSQGAVQQGAQNLPPSQPVQ